MCGIAGIVDLTRKWGRARLEAATTRMRETLAHRGPDDAGTWVDAHGVCALAQRRLAILDLSPLGHQPMVTDDGVNALVLNGEIYNYRALASKLQSQGIRLKSGSDTEVLLHLTRDQSPASLASLRGMFAIAQWNSELGQLFLARDPFGKKPLYVVKQNGLFAFASELRALESIPELDLEIDPAGLADYLLTGYIHSPSTIYRGVEKASPGSYLSLTQSTGEIRQGTFWSFTAGSHPAEVSLAPTYEGRVDQLDELITQAVERRLVSDVPVGAFLSAGVDSSLVVAAMKKLGVRPKTFTIGFSGSDNSEHTVARDIAAHLETDHREFVLDPKELQSVESIAAALDEPNGDSSCLPTLLLSRETRAHVTVALSGDGGDEMFGGYSRYLETLDEEARAHGDRSWNAVDSYLSPKTLTFSEKEVASFLGDARLVRQRLERRRRLMGQGSVPLIHRMRTHDVEYYMPGAVLAKVDRMSMQVALEVRCPLLDIDVARYAAALPAGDLVIEDAHRRFMGKRILKDVLRRYLPDRIVDRPKQGFGLPNTWHVESLVAAGKEMLGPKSALARLVDGKSLKRYAASLSDPQLLSIYQLWPMLILEFWLRGRRIGR